MALSHTRSHLILMKILENVEVLQDALQNQEQEVQLHMELCVPVLPLGLVYLTCRGLSIILYTQDKCCQD